MIPTISRFPFHRRRCLPSLPMNKQWQENQIEMRNSFIRRRLLERYLLSVLQDAGSITRWKMCIIQSRLVLLLLPVRHRSFYFVCSTTLRNLFCSIKFRRLLMASVPITLCHCVFCLISQQWKCLMCSQQLTTSAESNLVWWQRHHKPTIGIESSAICRRALISFSFNVWIFI